jgi:murein L,D-transpeptidase YafK
MRPNLLLRRVVPGVLLVLTLGTALLTGVLTSTGAGSPAATADCIVVEKANRTLMLYREGQVLKTYKIALGGHPIGPKEQQGDGRTPEGVYVIDARNRSSAFHRALHISYPNAEDRRRAAARRVQPGGDIMIHGLPNGWSAIGKAHLLRDWTNGCIAVTDAEIEEIWRLVPNGTRVEIRP